jgi:hypothetical protein
MTSRKKPGVAFWASVAVVVVFVAYPLSVGPASWACEHGLASEATLEPIYAPIFWLIDDPSRPLYDTWVGNLIEWYVELW